MNPMKISWLTTVMLLAVWLSFENVKAASNDTTAYLATVGTSNDTNSSSTTVTTTINASNSNTTTIASSTTAGGTTTASSANHQQSVIMPLSILSGVILSFLIGYT